MKELKFTTSKGEFLLLDGKDTITERLSELLKEYYHYSVVKEMTEEQFTEVVDKLEWSDGYFMYYRYDKSIHDFAETWLARDSFLSLIHSLGWYLWENPYQDPGLMPSAELDRYRKANDKVFFKPILLKKI